MPEHIPPFRSYPIRSHLYLPTQFLTLGFAVSRTPSVHAHVPLSTDVLLFTPQRRWPLSHRIVSHHTFLSTSTYTPPIHVTVPVLLLSPGLYAVAVISHRVPYAPFNL